MRNSAEVAKEVIWLLTLLPREGKAVRFHFPAPCPCVIAQHKIRLQKRNWLALAGSNTDPVPLHYFSLWTLLVPQRGGSAPLNEPGLRGPRESLPAQHIPDPPISPPTPSTGTRSQPSILPPRRPHGYFPVQGFPVSGLPLLLPELADLAPPLPCAAEAASPC